ncbi:hypothetical protein D9M70_544730 [compost metagenome]
MPCTFEEKRPSHRLRCLAEAWEMQHGVGGAANIGRRHRQWHAIPRRRMLPVLLKDSVPVEPSPKARAAIGLRVEIKVCLGEKIHARARRRQAINEVPALGHSHEERDVRVQSRVGEEKPSKGFANIALQVFLRDSGLLKVLHVEAWRHRSFEGLQDALWPSRNVRN